ncbi:hypothetical protein BGZ72_001694 [Mortierella alpina]|nr:hypothetical protein BGZ72_001694 [Mortierella alpina]
MEIRTIAPNLSTADPGFIELHYMELSIFQVNLLNDPTLELHQPYQWSIDVAHNGCSEGTAPADRSAHIMHHSVSGDSKFAATLSVLDNWLQLDLWDLESELVSMASELLVDTLIATGPKSSFCPRPCFQMR